MKKKLIGLTYVVLLSMLSCNISNKDISRNEKQKMTASSAERLSINASQYGVKYPETFILMQNRRGIRIEFCVDRGALQLWISPQAGKSFSYVDENWSNRDDHTRIFDRIIFPELNLNNYDSTSWDPFHSKLYFKDQVLNISQVYADPAVLIWFENEGLVDFKIYGEEISRDEKEFIFNHTSRGREFQSAAVLGPGEGYFQQQRYTDEHRSIHTRAHMNPGQLLVIASELNHEKIGGKAKDIAQLPIQTILENNEQQIQKDIKFGSFTLRDRPVMQSMLDINKRYALSMQSFNGFMRSTNQYIYYLLWFRDGGMNTAHLSYSGWENTVKDYVKFTLKNPNKSVVEPEARFFGQLMAGSITKWQEDGLFYAIWPAFSYWTQSGDDTFIKGEYLEVLEDAMQWLERYCYDEEKGLFGRYYACETPLANSHGEGWDDATGAPTFKGGNEYHGKAIQRSYDIYINLLNFSNYLMLSAMTSGEKADEYYKKARDLEQNIQIFFNYDDKLPSYGELLTVDNEIITAEPLGMDTWDYYWGLSLPPFKPNMPEKNINIQEGLYNYMTTTDELFFLCSYNALLTSMDPFIHDEDEIVRALDLLMPYSANTGKYLNMPLAIPEVINVEDGHPFHDVRPLVYSIAPWISAVTNLGVHRLPFGLGIRGTKHLDDISNYQYKQGLLNLFFEGEGNISEITINGNKLVGTLQIPEDRIVPETENEIYIRMGENAEHPRNLLISSTVLLNSFNDEKMDIEAFGQNILVFSNLNKQVKVVSNAGDQVTTDIQKHEGLSYVEFSGRGKFLVTFE